MCLNGAGRNPADSTVRALTDADPLQLIGTRIATDEGEKSGSVLHTLNIVQGAITVTASPDSGETAEHIRLCSVV